jgi:hypothetical protein
MYRFRAFLPWLSLIFLFSVLQTPPVAARQPSIPPGLFGLNMYITGQERRDSEAAALVPLAQQIGASWTREEISWANWGDRESSTFYDRRIGLIADGGIGIIGMLLTSHPRYRDASCVRYALDTNQPEYWCPPNNMNAFARWVGQVVERYDADGVNDAPGSPRVAAWEIWNEPDQDGTWLPKANPAAYAEMLRKSYDAVKAADPTALVLNGGVMTFDGIGVGGFMSKVVEIAGWNSFDVLSLHPWLIDHPPDNPALINPRERYDVTIPGRLEFAKRWLNERGGGKPIWITEVGWSVCAGKCEPQFAKSEEQQADYLVRTFALAAAAGVQHVSYFQLDDKFQGNHVPWGEMAILRDDLSPRPAYLAYGTMVGQLQFARYAGTGPLHQPNVLADYRFSLPDGGTVDVLWRISGTQQVDFPLAAGLYAQQIDRDGATRLLPQGRSARISVGERPTYVRQSNERVRPFAETGQSVREPFLSYWERNGGLPIFGLPISGEQTATGMDGREYRVQWFERNRFEYHPENPPASQVLLGLLGVEALARRGIDWQTLPKVTGPAAGCRYFAETGHTLCPPFRAYWERNGGLALFGYPISQPFEEVLGDGVTRTVQYFERNRFEYHPEQPQQYRVQLGRLGAELFAR